MQRVFRRSVSNWIPGWLKRSESFVDRFFNATSPPEVLPAAELDSATKSLAAALHADGNIQERKQIQQRIYNKVAELFGAHSIRLPYLKNDLDAIVLSMDSRPTEPKTNHLVCVVRAMTKRALGACEVGFSTLEWMDRVNRKETRAEVWQELIDSVGRDQQGFSQLDSDTPLRLPIDSAVTDAEEQNRLQTFKFPEVVLSTALEKEHARQIHDAVVIREAVKQKFSNEKKKLRVSVATPELESAWKLLLREQLMNQQIDWSSDEIQTKAISPYIALVGGAFESHFMHQFTVARAVKLMLENRFEEALQLSLSAYDMFDFLPYRDFRMHMPERVLLDQFNMTLQVMGNMESKTNPSRKHVLSTVLKFAKERCEKFAYWPPLQAGALVALGTFCRKHHSRSETYSALKEALRLQKTYHFSPLMCIWSTDLTSALAQAAPADEADALFQSAEHAVLKAANSAATLELALIKLKRLMTVIGDPSLPPKPEQASQTVTGMETVLNILEALPKTLFEIHPWATEVRMLSIMCASTPLHRNRLKSLPGFMEAIPPRLAGKYFYE